MKIEYKKNDLPGIEEVISLYKSVGWGQAQCPNATYNAIKNSTLTITAWHNNKLVGLGRAISDGCLTVYFPDLLVKPEYQRHKIGTEIMRLLLSEFGNLHNQVLIAEDDMAREFYRKMGFSDEKSALSILKPFPIEKSK